MHLSQLGSTKFAPWVESLLQGDLNVLSDVQSGVSEVLHRRLEKLVCRRSSSRQRTTSLGLLADACFESGWLAPPSVLLSVTIFLVVAILLESSDERPRAGPARRENVRLHPAELVGGDHVGSDEFQVREAEIHRACGAAERATERAFDRPCTRAQDLGRHSYHETAEQLRSVVRYETGVAGSELTL